MQVLDDHSMNLQSMSASPFIGPFLSTVQKWEKCLTLVAEMLDEWIATQRKWMYLEGIFIGGDIRDQLPEEAQKFDDIDKTFMRVCRAFLRAISLIKFPFVCRLCTAQRRNYW